MLKSKQFTKEQYNYTTEILKLCGQECLSYDQIQTRCKYFKTQQPIIDENDTEQDQYVYYGVVNCIKYLYADPFIAKKIHNGNKPEDLTKEPLFNYEPYASKGFQELKKKCSPDETPIVIMYYIDEFRKHRTGTDKTAGLYFTLLNFNRSFLTSNMESISLLGNSKTNISQFKLATKLVEELNEINGKSIDVYNSYTDSIEKIRILIGPWIWDSVQRWLSLFLESYTCSKCKCPKGDYCKCPNDISTPLVYPLRTVTEAIEMQQKLSIGTSCNGYKFITVADIQIKDMQIDSKSKKSKQVKEKVRQSNNTQMKCPFLQIKDCDIFENSTVELMHGSIQGDLRRHLKKFFKYFNYTNILSDFQSVMDKYTNNHGKPLKMIAKDYNDCSADHFLEFVVFSCPIIYDFLINNKNHCDVSFSLKKKHIICWSNHVEYVLSLIQDLVSPSNIEIAKLKHFNFRKQVISLYGNGNFTNPNFHWNSHIFEDCLKWGNARFFWALLFELKHKVFKQFNDSSNHKNLEQRGANFEKLQRQININYPWVRNQSENKKWIPIVQNKEFILFKAKDGSLLVGQFVEVKEQKVYFTNIKKCLSSVHPIIGYRLIDSNIHVTTGYVALNQIIGKCLIHNIAGKEMFNQYSFFMNFHKVKF
ncbi:predicted protein [Naegleria gruberi]|uniref:Predicted protein n=1 Tax=Naegleria gruberi TaxID=5762 RepID=D2VAA4_NAEGR|nr:uncharacterized protein NAEGRDRAFT_65790 [Naegleria gruberi]EFC46396.1 predicted protein [Naegleria gruberi]|eukprot:XP_002679140.1 predicted protein [Naegleria gruberi strain NEG-M]